MKKFEQPVIETIVYDYVDVIATSSYPDVDDSGFNNQVVKP